MSLNIVPQGQTCKTDWNVSLWVKWHSLYFPNKPKEKLNEQYAHKWDVGDS